MKTIEKGTCDKKMFCTKILVKKIKTKGNNYLMERKIQLEKRGFY